MLAFHKLACISTGIMLLLASCSNLNSIQTSAYEGPERNSFRKESSLALNTIPEYRNDIPVKVIRSFIKEFTDSENVSWQKTDEGLFIAKFVTDSIEKKIDFNRRGSWNHIWSRYIKIPQEISAMVENKFFSYTISEVSGLTFPWDRKNIIYGVLIKNGDNSKTLKIYKGQMDVLSDFENDIAETK